MKSRYLSNIILLLVIIALVYFVYDKPKVETSQTTSLSQLKPDDIKHIVITRQTKPAIEINKHGELWQITKPLHATANEVRIKLILDLLTSHPRSQLTISDDIDLSQFNLSPPALTLQLDQQLFEFGSIESLSKQRYIKYNNAIYLVDDSIAPLLKTSVTNFIDNRLVNQQQSISQLILPLLTADNKFSEKTIIIELVNGHWRSQPLLPNDKLTGIVQAWQHAYAMQVLQQGHHKKSGHKIILKDKNASYELIVNTSKSNLSISNENTQLNYQFPIELVQQLFPKIESE